MVDSISSMVCVSILFNDFSTGFQPAFQPFFQLVFLVVVLDRFFAFSEWHHPKLRYK
jgi:hypothetical protein